MNEPTLRNRSFKIQLATMVAAIVSIVGSSFMGAKYYFEIKGQIESQNQRIISLEDFRIEGGRYTSTDAARDFLLRDQRIDSLQSKFESDVSDIKFTLNKIDKKLDLLFIPK